MEMYETLGVLGEGTYGVVVKARHKETQQLVAIKKFKESEDDEQVRKTSLREIRMLKNLRHFNIVNLLDVFRRKQKLYLVFEFIDRTILELVEKKPYGLDEGDVRKYTYQLLRAVDYCHRNNVIHRDIKPENILIAKNGTLKLCDFGFARALGGAGAKYTEYVATRWYRSPELLVGDTEYGRPVDVWAIGCIFAEISNGMPLFPGESDIDQLHHIIRCFGRLISRHEQVFKRNPLYAGIELPVPRMLEALEVRYGGPTFSKVWLQFLKSCLRNDPEARETCPSLMGHAYFAERGFRQGMEEELERMERQDKVQNAWWHNSSNSAPKPMEDPPTATGDAPIVAPKPISVKPLSVTPTPAHAEPITPTPFVNPLPVITSVQQPPPQPNSREGLGPTQPSQTRHPIAMFGTTTGVNGYGTRAPALGLFAQDFNVVKGLGKKNSTLGLNPNTSTTVFPTLGSGATELKMVYKKKSTTSPTVAQPPAYGLGLYQGITGTTILHSHGSIKPPSTSHIGQRRDSDSHGGAPPMAQRRSSKPWDPK